MSASQNWIWPGDPLELLSKAWCHNISYYGNTDNSSIGWILVLSEIDPWTLLQAQFVHSSVKDHIKSCVFRRLQRLIIFNFWNDWNWTLFKAQSYFLHLHMSDGDDKKCKISHMTSVVYCLPGNVLECTRSLIFGNKVTWSIAFG